MMEYKNYSVEDFLAEESFQQYCAGSNKKVVTFWEDILKQEPQIEETFNEAIGMYNLLNANQGNLLQQTERLKKRIQPDQDIKPIKRIPIYRWWAAAAISLLLASGSYLYFRQSYQKQIAKTETQPGIKNDVAPGGNRAVLKLADGTQIILDSANNGTLTQQGNTKIIKLNNGELAYSPSGDEGKVLYNTISTPKGGQFQIVLSDGTKVWLNAASSLKFPASFAGKERNVELTGEGYFEVAKNPSMPFNVTVGEMKVQVIGTHFNINAYNDEAIIKTTLLEGSVKVSTSDYQSAVLKPNQQAQLQTTNYKLQTVNNVDVSEAMAWKDGFFEFEDMEIPVIMRQIERWYDVSIEYKHTGDTEKFGGRISRNLSLASVLKLLDVRFRLEGNKLIIL